MATSVAIAKENFFFIMFNFLWRGARQRSLTAGPFHTSHYLSIIKVAQPYCSGKQTRTAGRVGMSHTIYHLIVPRNVGRSKQLKLRPTLPKLKIHERTMCRVYCRWHQLHLQTNSAKSV